MKKILGLLLVSSSIFSMQLDVSKSERKSNDLHISNTNKVQIKPQSFFAPERLGIVTLYHCKNGFCVHKDDKKHVIKKYFTDPMVRDITKEQLKSFVKNGYFVLNQMNDREFSLKAKGRVVGGGPMFGAFMYWATKSVCYGTAVAAVGTVAVGTAGVGVALASSTLAVAGTGAVAGAAAATTTVTITAAAASTTVAAGTVTAIAGASAAAVTGGASVVATAIAVTSAAGTTVGGMSLTAAAATTTAGVVTSAGGIAATIAGVEAVSLAVGTFFGMLPTP